MTGELLAVSCSSCGAWPVRVGELHECGGPPGFPTSGFVLLPPEVGEGVECVKWHHDYRVRYTAAPRSEPPMPGGELALPPAGVRCRCVLPLSDEDLRAWALLRWRRLPVHLL